MANVNPIPEGFHTITPHIVTKDTNAAIEFYKKAFGAAEICRVPGPDGKSVMHAELKIGDSIVMMCDEFPEMDNCRAPASLNGTTCTLTLYVTDCDATFKQATDAGAEPVMPPVDMFWGDRYSKVSDPFGHSWAIATHIKDLTPEEICKAAQEAFSGPGPQ